MSQFEEGQIVYMYINAINVYVEGTVKEGGRVEYYSGSRTVYGTTEIFFSTREEAKANYIVNSEKELKNTVSITRSKLKTAENALEVFLDSDDYLEAKENFPELFI